ncbi:heavy-metal-associated domain-containing protein [Gammaproteobacteria bacterium]|nr:heavy-metal-associated domain-containing protein [Gammaproteobacteria bacterium]
MNKLYFMSMLVISSFAWAEHDHDHDHGDNHAIEMEAHSHEGHMHDVLVDGKKLEVDPDRFDKFVEGQKNLQVAVISVNGMVCDFCARGIERTFKKDKSVQKIDVDLSRGKVLVMFTQSANVDFEDIKQKILSNGQNATDLQIILI